MDEEPFNMRTRKKHCVMVQTDFREEESLHLYSDCAYHPEAEPECFTNGVGLHYPEIREKEMSPECDSVCYEKEERPWYLSAMNKIPSYMTKVVTSKSDKKLELVYPHRNKPPFQTPHKRTMQNFTAPIISSALKFQGTVRRRAGKRGVSIN
ncbi:hypothetical protein Mapa_016806 [Marchantia paleacea]|nr:hypothetical protein Mapa_016806 [Marchantia paleacea]